MGVTVSYLKEQLEQKFGTSVLQYSEPFGFPTIELEAVRIIELLNWLKEHAELQMNFLTDITGIHYPDQKGKELGVVYHVHGLVHNIRLRIKCFLPVENPVIESATAVYSAANWMERETYDFFGIQFQGHPDLKRILNVDEMNYFPMRKEYPLEDGTRTDKDDNYFGR